MRIFVTGGTGYIGSHVVRRLVGRGDEVRALARSDGSATRAEELGATAVRGDVSDGDLLRAEAKAADAAINLAVLEQEPARTAAQALTAADVYVHTGAIWSFGNTHGGGDETHPLQPPALTAWRTPIEEDVLARGGVVVMPGVVYGDGRGLLPLVFGDGHYVGDGHYHVAVVHVEDAADLYVRALEAPQGIRLVAVAQAVAAREIAEALVGGAGTSQTLAEAGERLGPELAEAMTLDQRFTAVRTRELGWAPAHRDVLGELRAT